MKKPKPLEKIKLLPKNMFYVYTRRKRKDEYWRRGKVIMIPALLPVHARNAARTAFFNSDIGKTFTPSKKRLKQAQKNAA